MFTQTILLISTKLMQSDHDDIIAHAELHTRNNVLVLKCERFMLPLEKLCSNVLPFLVLLCVWKVVNFSTILIVNIAGSRLYNQRMKMLNVFCNTGDVCTEYLL